MSRHSFASIVAVLLVGVAAVRVGAAERCTMSCRAEVAACRRSECGSARGAARHECIELCRGRSGCPARIRTLAYVVTRCRAQGGQLMGSQELRIRRGDCHPVTVMPVEGAGEQDDPFSLCQTVAENRAGFGSPIAGVFQRLGVTPDGSGVVFEVTNKFELIGKTPLADEQQGFFYVRADGSGLRRLGPPSDDRAFRILGLSAGVPNADATYQTYLPFSPSGRLVAYPDLDGNHATQIFTLDIVTQQRTQVTRLPPSTLDPLADYFSVSGQVFLDEQTIQFLRVPENAIYTTRANGSGLLHAPAPLVPKDVEAGLPPPAAKNIGVAQPIGRVVDFGLPATTGENASVCSSPEVVETFRVVGGNVLQLTTFGRCDTRSISPGPSRSSPLSKGRVLLTASAPSPENRFENCQLFSIGPWAGGLRQLTNFDESARSKNGCGWNLSPGCSVSPAAYQDPVTHWIVFYSSCHPFDPNFVGSEVFAMRPDGRQLRQLTHTGGVHWVGDVVDVEIPGPIAYSTPTR